MLLLGGGGELVQFPKYIPLKTAKKNRGVDGGRGGGKSSNRILTSSCVLLSKTPCTSYIAQHPTPSENNGPSINLTACTRLHSRRIDRCIYHVVRSWQGSTPTPPPLCRTLPKPVAFNTLPKPIQDELSSIESLFEEQIELVGPVSILDLFAAVFSVIVFLLSQLLIEHHKCSQPMAI